MAEKKRIRSDSPPRKRARKAGAFDSLLFLFAHGAGTDSSHPSMQKWAALIREGFPGARVELFDYVKPWGVPRLRAQHLAALRGALQKHPGVEHVVFIGKSMGSRIGVHAALDLHGKNSRPRPCACICLGYPLVGQNGTVRDQVLLDLPKDAAVLFVSGTRDKMCPREQLEKVRERMVAPSRGYEVEAGDHGLNLTKTRQKQVSQAAADRAVVEQIKSFLSTQCGVGSL